MTEKIIKKKEFGLYKVVASIKAMATSEGTIQDKKVIESRILITRENLKREFLIDKIYIDEIKSAEEIDDYPEDKALTVYLNPYFELNLVENLRPFAVDIRNEEALKWLSDFETYLAMHLLYYRDFKKVLPSVDEFNYTSTELMEAKAILIKYYDLVNSKTLEGDSPYLYYYPKRLLIQRIKEDVLNYEVALVAKALFYAKDLDSVRRETGFDDKKIIGLLKKIKGMKNEKLSLIAKEMLEKQP